MSTVAIIEQEFGASYSAIHESAHAAAAVLLGLELVAFSADEGLTAVLTRRGDLGEQARLAVAYAMPAVLLERCGTPAVGCEDDYLNIEAIQRVHEYRTGVRLNTWGDARRLLRDPAFGTGLMRLVQVLEAVRRVHGSDAVAMLADLPRRTELVGT